MEIRTGVARGGPIDGQTISAHAKRLQVPVKVGPDLGEGNRGFGAANYLWKDGMWMYDESLAASPESP